LSNLLEPKLSALLRTAPIAAAADRGWLPKKAPALFPCFFTWGMI
jgi:hypothetical protein